MDYGYDYFLSKYNSDFCADNSTCGSGFACISTDLKFETVSADYSTPFTSLISNMAFLTLRGWPNIYWAIVEATDYYTASGILFVCVVFGSLMVVNMFPAILIAALRKQQERASKSNLLRFYTGDKDSVTELELIAWAAKNDNALQKRMLDSQANTIPTQLFRWVWGKVSPKSHKKHMDKLVYAKKEIEKDKGVMFIMDPVANVGIFPWRPCVPRCRSWDILRDAIVPDDSAFNLTIIGLVIANIILLSLVGLDNTDAVMLYGELVCTVAFSVELVVKLVLLGPVVYLDSAFNMLDCIWWCWAS